MRFALFDFGNTRKSLGVCLLLGSHDGSGLGLAEGASVLLVLVNASLADLQALAQGVITGNGKLGQIASVEGRIGQAANDSGGSAILADHVSFQNIGVQGSLGMTGSVTLGLLRGDLHATTHDGQTNSLGVGEARELERVLVREVVRFTTELSSVTFHKETRVLAKQLPR